MDRFVTHAIRVLHYGRIHDALFEGVLVMFAEIETDEPDLTGQLSRRQGLDASNGTRFGRREDTVQIGIRREDILGGSPRFSGIAHAILLRDYANSRVFLCDRILKSPLALRGRLA